jgi:hypothetical protein
MVICDFIAASAETDAEIATHVKAINNIFFTFFDFIESPPINNIHLLS